MSKVIYRIRNKKDGLYFAGNNYSGKQKFGKTPKTYSTRAAARKSIEWYISSTLGKEFFKSSDISFERAKTLISLDLEVVELTVEITESQTYHMDNFIHHVIMRRKIAELSPRLAYFWDVACSKGFSDTIQYIFEVEHPKGQSNKATMKQARDQLRLLDVKSNQYREYNGMFGFVSKDQAMAARLTLDVAQFIDVDKIRSEVNKVDVGSGT